MMFCFSAVKVFLHPVSTFITSLRFSQKELDLLLLTALARAVNHQSNDVKRVAGVGLQHVTRRDLSPAEMKVL